MNPGGDPISLNPSEKLHIDYDILNFWDFPQVLTYKVKVGTFSPYFPSGQQLSISEDRIEWSIGVEQQVGGILHHYVENTGKNHVKCLGETDASS